ncbi:MAG: hypothetical protein IIU29_06640 [Erysipelotrichaceae bacterium]|nr:hypothetical protein [Erysipelotrichaceae bacterium]
MLFSKLPAILIDSENVGSTWTSLLSKDERFELYICVTENAKSLNFTLLKQLTDEHRYKINIIECKPGKNSLDFYLSSYLGYLIGKNRHSSYTVVSQDTGYDSVIEYWCNEGYDVKRINTKPETPKKAKASRKSSKKKNEAMPQKNQPKKENRQLPVVRKDQLPSLQVKQQPKTETRPLNQPAEMKNPNQISSEKRIIVKDENRKPLSQEKPEVKELKQEKPEQAKPKKKAASKQPKKKEAPAEKEGQPKKETKKEEKKASVSLDAVKQVLTEYPDNEVEDVVKYLNKVPSEKRADKNYIYRGLVRKFKSEKGLAIYTLLKKDLDRFYRTEQEQQN